LESIGDHVRENDIEWIVTVPAIWTEIAKNITKMAAEKAGMQKVKLSLEPEAAALTIFEDLKISASPLCRRFVVVVGCRRWHQFVV
jgi:molecular chaperone DnaK (HSP70)